MARRFEKCSGMPSPSGPHPPYGHLLPAGEGHACVGVSKGGQLTFSRREKARRADERRGLPPLRRASTSQHQLYVLLRVDVSHDTSRCGPCRA